LIADRLAAILARFGRTAGPMRRMGVSDKPRTGRPRTRPCLVTALIAIAGLAVWPSAGAAEPDRDTAATIRHLICRMVDSAAAANRLPSGFLTRVIWQESRFRSNARSPAGAEGVAQFMPQTAAERGLADPSDPEQAIAHAARFLAELVAQFGNRGLAAAAYNAGPGRVAKWLQGQADLPAETRIYVAAVTGRQPEDWRGQRADFNAIGHEPCVAVTEELARAGRTHAARALAPAWQVRLDNSLAAASRLLAAMPRPQHAAPTSSAQASVDALCASIRSLGASCHVFSR
jgi:hypothetical protein